MKRDDRETRHACPYHAERRLSSCKTGIQKAQTRYHDHHHCRGYDNVGLVSGGIPLVEILERYETSIVSQVIASIAVLKSVPDTFEDKVIAR